MRMRLLTRSRFFSNAVVQAWAETEEALLRTETKAAVYFAVETPELAATAAELGHGDGYSWLGSRTSRVEMSLGRTSPGLIAPRAATSPRPQSRLWSRPATRSW